MVSIRLKSFSLVKSISTLKSISYYSELIISAQHIERPDSFVIEIQEDKVD